MIIGVIFIYSGLEKIISTADFAASVQNYRIVPVELTNLVGIILPWLEFYCGLFLIIGIFKQASAAIIFTLLLIFIFILLSALIRGLDIECGCFGSGANVSWFRIIEDIILLLMSLHLFFYPSKIVTGEKFLFKSAKLVS
jgi:uncharacterized membrane protein YphA (DoxX/SURF4 family)